MTIRRGIRPTLRPAIDLPDGDDALRVVFPFRRHWIAIGLLVVFDAVFLLPAIGTLRQAVAEWGSFDSLFDLVVAVFLSAWLLGWMIAPLVITLVLAVLLFGREVVTVRRGAVKVFLGLPLVGIAASYDPARMRNLRLVRPERKSGTSWRGPHLAFDYGANAGQMGVDLDALEAAQLIGQVEMAAGTRIRDGDALSEELEETWEDPAAVILEAGPGTQTDPETGPGAGSGARAEPASLVSLSALALVAANLVPVAGAVLLDWRLSDVMVLYWAESAVIGFFNLLKIAVIGRWWALLAGPFFVGHFGGFMAVHFLFVYGIFVEGPQASTGGDLAEVGRMFADLWPALLALLASHGYSFFANFLGRGEYRRRTVKKQMAEPYTRIVLMHVTLIFGGFVVLMLGDSAPVLLAVIASKVFFDLRAHVRQHDADEAPPARRSRQTVTP